MHSWLLTANWPPRDIPLEQIGHVCQGAIWVHNQHVLITDSLSHLQPEYSDGLSQAESAEKESWLTQLQVRPKPPPSLTFPSVTDYKNGVLECSEGSAGQVLEGAW